MRKNLKPPWASWKIVVLVVAIAGVVWTPNCGAVNKNVWIESPVDTSASAQSMIACYANAVYFTARTSWPQGATWSWSGADMLTANTSWPTSDARKTFLTPGGPYSVTATYNGETSFEANVTVIQLTHSPSQLWWFNGQDAANYAEQVTLTAQGATQGTFTWDVLYGGNLVTLNNGGADSQHIVATDDPDVVVKSTGASTQSNDVIIQLSYSGSAGSASCTHGFTVLAPNSLSSLGNADYASGTGYVSYANYKILDQFGNLLPASVEINEQWTTDVVYDTINANWVRGGPGGTTVNPSSWADGMYSNLNAYPSEQNPQNPLGTWRVIHWGQAWNVGSTTIGSGRRVQLDTLQMYTDHARHE